MLLFPSARCRSGLEEINTRHLVSVVLMDPGWVFYVLGPREYFGGLVLTPLVGPWTKNLFKGTLRIRVILNFWGPVSVSRTSSSLLSTGTHYGVQLCRDHVPSVRGVWTRVVVVRNLFQSSARTR